MSIITLVRLKWVVKDDWMDYSYVNRWNPEGGLVMIYSCKKEKGRQRKYLYATDGKLERNGNDKWNRCAVRMTIRIMSTLQCMTDDKRCVAFRGKCANYLRGNVIQCNIFGHTIMDKNLVPLCRLDLKKRKNTKMHWSVLYLPGGSGHVFPGQELQNIVGGFTGRFSQDCAHTHCQLQLIASDQRCHSQLTQGDKKKTLSKHSYNII